MANIALFHPAAPPHGQAQHLAAIRTLFDYLVKRTWPQPASPTKKKGPRFAASNRHWQLTLNPMARTDVLLIIKTPRPGGRTPLLHLLPHVPGNWHYPDVIDPDVPVLTVRGEDGALRAVVFGYACHNTTLDDYLVSGDWAGYAEAGVETGFPGAVALFVQGCGAEANPLPRHSEELAKLYGKVITDAAAEVVGGKAATVDGPIQGAYREVNLPLEKPPSREEFERRTTTGSEMERRHARMMLELMAKGPLPAAHMWQAQGWRIGKSFTVSVRATHLFPRRRS